MNITFWRPGGIGDALLSIPALQALRAQQEGGVTFIGHIGAGKLLERAGLVDEARRQNAQNSPDNYYSGAVEIAGRLGMQFDERRRRSAVESMGDPDLAIAFSTDPLALSYAFEQLSIPKFTTQHWQPPIGTHQSEFMCLAVRNLGYLERYEVNVVDFRCEVPKIDYLVPSRTIVLHPGAGLAYKQWPLDRFVVLSSKLQSVGYHVLVLQGPGESYRSSFPGARVLELSLQDTAGLLSLRMPFVGNDSGITHLAALSGCPTIGLYGPTDPTQWGPIGSNVTIIRNCTEESTGAVRICHDPKCMEGISVRNVLSYLIEESIGATIRKIGGGEHVLS